MGGIYKEENNIYQIDLSLEYLLGDTVTRRAIRNKIAAKLPFALQAQLQVKKQLIKEFQVLSIAEWNAHSTYGEFPLS